MADMITAVVTKVEDDTDFNGKAYKKVTLGTGQELKVKQGRDGVLKAKWGLLQEGTAIQFIMQDFTKPDGVKIPFVYDIKLVADELQPPTDATILAEHEEVIQEAREAVKQPPTRSEEISHHVAMKEIGEGIRSGLIKNTGATAPYWKLYWLWLSNTLNVHPEEK